MPMVLHANFMHLLMNALSTLVIGSGLEASIGFWRIAALYFVSGVGGILFSCVFNPTGKSVGASTSIFGLMGFYVSYLYINWTALGERNSNQRFSLCIFTGLMLLFNF